MKKKNNKIQISNILFIAFISLVVIALIPVIVIAFLIIRYQIACDLAEKEWIKNATAIEVPNRSANLEALKVYLKETYGDALYSTFEEIENLNQKEAQLQTWEDSIFRIHTPFLENGFTVLVKSNTHKPEQDGFYTVIKSDPKFQHLYSEWVKKQIGCEDSDVELKFANFDMNEQININFAYIKDVSSNYDDLFKNISKFYLIEFYKKNINDLSKNNYKIYADNINNKYYTSIVNLIGNSNMEHYIEMFNNNVNLLDINYHLLGKTDYSKIDIHYEVCYD